LSAKSITSDAMNSLGRAAPRIGFGKPGWWIVRFCTLFTDTR
tara:strand:- start:39 stop:164 length:126 start_codon:yes stop_codon:yes gene_type:complete